jgi:tetratricopeptide (TPR) repeat protein
MGISGRDGAAAVVLPEAALAAARLLGSAFGGVDLDRPERGVEWADRAVEWLGLVPHVRAVLATRGRLPGTGERELAECATRVVVALAWAGSWAAALEVADAAAGRGSGLASDDPAVLLLRFYRADVLRLLGRYADAEGELRQVLDRWLRVPGSDHPTTLMARHDLAYMLSAQGRHADAEAGYRQVLDAQLRVLGPGHPGTVMTRHGIASVLAAQGRYADAEAGYRQVLDAWLRVLGPDHPQTLTTHDALRRLSRQ